MGVALTVFAVIGILVVLIIAVIVGVVIWARRLLAKLQAEQLSEYENYPDWAEEHDLTYRRREDDHLEHVAQHMPMVQYPPQQGHVIQGQHVFSGTVNGREAVLFQPTIAHDPHARQVSALTVAIAKLDQPVQDMIIIPKSRMSRVNSARGQRLIRDSSGRSSGYLAYSPGAPYRKPEPTPAQADWLSGFDSPYSAIAFHLKGDWATCYLGGPFTWDRGLAVFEALGGLLAADATADTDPDSMPA